MLKHTNIELRSSPLCVSANGLRDRLGALCIKSAYPTTSEMYIAVQSALLIHSALRAPPLRRPACTSLQSALLVHIDTCSQA